MAPVDPIDRLERIRNAPAVWLRVAAVLRANGQWHARLVELTTGCPPPSWSALSWRYPKVLILAGKYPGAKIAVALGARSISLAGRKILLPELRGVPFWERRQSFGLSNLGRLEWPTDETQAGDVDNEAEPHDPLVSADGAPSFVDFGTAAACVFLPEHPPMGWSLPRGLFVRHQDTSGRISKVRIGDGLVGVVLEGAGLSNMSVELAGEAPGPVVHLGTVSGASHSVDFPLENGLPSGAWVLLKRGSTWVDRRSLTRPWTIGADADVEFIVEPRTRLEAFLEDREGAQVEFKRLPPDTDETKAKVMKTVCAFANGEGGSVLFGVDDDGEALGIATSGIAQLIDSLTQMAGSWVEPRPTLDFQLLPLDENGMAVLEMRVMPGAGLHGSRSRRGSDPVVYVRHYATSVRARPGEIEQIVRSRGQAGRALSAPSHAGLVF